MGNVLHSAESPHRARSPSNSSSLSSSGSRTSTNSLTTSSAASSLSLNDQQPPSRRKSESSLLVCDCTPEQCHRAKHAVERSLFTNHWGHKSDPICSTIGTIELPDLEEALLQGSRELEVREVRCCWCCQPADEGQRPSHGRCAYLIRLSSPASQTSWTVARTYADIKLLKRLLQQEGGVSAAVLLPDPDVSSSSVRSEEVKKIVSRRKEELRTWLACIVEDLDKQMKAPTSPTAKLKGDRAFTDFFTLGSFDVTSEEDEDSLSHLCVSKGDFEALKVIGKGSFGKVTLVRKRDTRVLYAMKVLKKCNLGKKKRLEHALTERKVLGEVDHPYIVRLFYAFQTKAKLYLVLEYCPGGELFFHLTRMRKFTEPLARHFASEIILALDYLHKRGIIYRDLKPENVLLTEDGHVKLVDFGLSKCGVRQPTNGTRTLCGSPEYLAPEVIDGKRQYGTAVDWWSLGMVIYEMLTGLPPWYSGNPKLLASRIKNAELRYPKTMSAEAVALVSSLLRRDPCERLGSRHGAMEIMCHPFFLGVDWMGLRQGTVPSPFSPCANSWVSDSAVNFDPAFGRLPVDSTDGPTTEEGGVNAEVIADIEAPKTVKGVEESLAVGMVEHDDDVFKGFEFYQPSAPAQPSTVLHSTSSFYSRSATQHPTARQPVAAA